MKVIFCGGNYIKPMNEAEKPEYSEDHKRYYMGGFRWIKSKRHWSSNALLHNFTNFEWIDEAEIGD